MSQLVDIRTHVLDARPRDVTISGSRRLSCMPRPTAPSETPLAALSVIEFRPRRGWPGRRRRPRRALRPDRIVIDGAVVTMEHRDRATTWQRATVSFACPRTADWPWWTGPRQCLFVTVGDGEPLVVDCDRFSLVAFDSLTRHLRNFQAIADAANGPWTYGHPPAARQVPA